MIKVISVTFILLCAILFLLPSLEEQDDPSSIKLSWSTSEVPKTVRSWKSKSTSSGRVWEKNQVKCLDTNSDNLIDVVDFNFISHGWVRWVDNDKDGYFDKTYNDNYAGKIIESANIHIKVPSTN